MAEIGHHLRRSRIQSREETMPSTAPHSERKPAQSDLLSQYRAIGPAAILAALICARKKRAKNGSSPVKPA